MSGSGCWGPSRAWVLRLCPGPRRGGHVEGPSSSTQISIWDLPHSTAGGRDGLARAGSGWACGTCLEAKRTQDQIAVGTGGYILALDPFLP